MNYAQFKKEWKDNMAYRPSEIDDLEQLLNDYYTEYKSDPMFSKMTVKEWCEFYFAEFDLDTHPYMIKMKAISSKHADGLRDLINKRFSHNVTEQFNDIANGRD